MTKTGRPKLIIQHLSFLQFRDDFRTSKDLFGNLFGNLQLQCFFDYRSHKPRESSEKPMKNPANREDVFYEDCLTKMLVLKFQQTLRPGCA